MQVQVLVRVDVIQPQAGRPESLELRHDLGLELAANRCPEEEAKAACHEVAMKLAIMVDQIRHALGSQHGASLNQHDMQPDP